MENLETPGFGILGRSAWHPSRCWSLRDLLSGRRRLLCQSIPGGGLFIEFTEIGDPSIHLNERHSITSVHLATLDCRDEALNGGISFNAIRADRSDGNLKKLRVCSRYLGSTIDPRYSGAIRARNGLKTDG